MTYVYCASKECVHNGGGTYHEGKCTLDRITLDKGNQCDDYKEKNEEEINE